MYVYDEPEYECRVKLGEEFGRSAPGTIDCFLVAGPPDKNRVGGITFGLFESIKIVETHRLANNEWNNVDPAKRRRGLCTELFMRLLDEYPDYEFRMSGPLESQSTQGQQFITAMRDGNESKGRPPLPYHENACFQPNTNRCVCTIGDRVRSTVSDANND